MGVGQAEATGHQPIARHLPITTWLPAYQRAWLRGDLTAAATVWALVVPEAVAYAQLAGLPPYFAFYAVPPALIAYAIFGSSRHLVVGVTSASAILSAATIGAVAKSPDEYIALSATLAIMVGIILVLAGVLRLGRLADFVAEAVLTGFLFGLGLTIMVHQLPKLFGLPDGTGDFFQRLWEVISNLGSAKPVTVVVGFTAVASLLLLHKFAHKLPASLLVLAAGVAVSVIAGLGDLGVAVVGDIPRSLPVPALPLFDVTSIIAMIGGAFGIALVVFAESLSVAKHFASKHRYDVDANQELVALGASNVASGAFQGFSVSGSATETSTAEVPGTRSPMTLFLAAAFVLATGEFLGVVFTQLPEAILGAIVIVAVRGFLRVSEMIRLWRGQKTMFAVAAAALVFGLGFDLMAGLAIAIVLSLLIFVWSSADQSLSVLGNLPGTKRYADISNHPDATITPGLLIVRPDGELFFANAPELRTNIRRLAKPEPPTDAPTIVLLDLGLSYRLDLSVADILFELVRDLEGDGVGLWFAEVGTDLRRDLDRTGLSDRVGSDHVFHSIADAVEAFSTKTGVDKSSPAD